jgi:hypothetical protein
MRLGHVDIQCYINAKWAALERCGVDVEGGKERHV